MKRKITKTDNKGRQEEWSWEETPELTEWIKKNNAPKVKPRPIRPTT